MGTIFQFLLIILFIDVSFCNDELYNILGVHRGANNKDIKQAYKKLAREWHPDKNNDPTATDKFTKINEAYETLSDPEKRANYDNYGFTSAQERQPRHPGGGGGGFHPFDDFFSGGFGPQFGFRGRDSGTLDKFTVTMRNYESKLNPESHRTPCFFYVYSDFCFSCMRIEPVVSKFMTELDSIGMCVGAIHIRRSMGLADHLRVSSAPTLIGVVSGRIHYYKSSSISFNLLRDFMRGIFPSFTMVKLNDGSFKNFLEGWKDNRVRAIFFGTKPEPSLRFLAPAFYHHERVAFGYVNTHASDVSAILKQNNINKYRESLLVWNEESHSPIASITMQQLSRSTIDEVVSSNRFLTLPRLSSQNVFDELCPQHSRNKKHKRLCVALVTRRSWNHEEACATFRTLAQTSKYPPETVRYAYIYEDVQQNFIKALTKGNETRSQVFEVIIIWRTDSRRVHYEFLEEGWSLKPETAPQSRKVLEKRLTQILEGDQLLAYRAIIPEFYNEHMLGLFTRILYKLRDWTDRVYYLSTSYDGMTILTAVGALIFMGMMALSMKKLAENEAEQVKKERLSKQVQKRPPSCSVDNQTIHLYEIRSETFANLVSEADTGLTITILIDETSREKLLHTFAEIMQPYSRYSGLTFAFMQLEYYLEWYRHLLELSMDFKVSLDSINNRNCVGTVLAINGYRKYYYIYHPKRARKWMRKHHGGSNVTKAVGFADSDSSDSEESGTREENVVFLEEVLNGLTIWLDRVFDGSVKKVRLPYWPEMK